MGGRPCLIFVTATTVCACVKKSAMCKKNPDLTQKSSYFTCYGYIHDTLGLISSFGDVKFLIQKSCLCKRNDKYEVWVGLALTDTVQSACLEQEWWWNSFKDGDYNLASFSNAFFWSECWKVSYHITKSSQVSFPIKILQILLRPALKAAICIPFPSMGSYLTWSLTIQI